MEVDTANFKVCTKTLYFSICSFFTPLIVDKSKTSQCEWKSLIGQILLKCSICLFKVLLFMLITHATALWFCTYRSVLRIYFDMEVSNSDFLATSIVTILLAKIHFYYFVILYLYIMFPWSIIFKCLFLVVPDWKDISCERKVRSFVKSLVFGACQSRIISHLGFFLLNHPYSCLPIKTLIYR